MKLAQAQLEQFDRDGYLFFPSLFTPEEIRLLTDEVPRLYAQRRPENVREKGSDAVRTNFAAHMYSYPFARLARHPRMVGPVTQIFGEPVYMHQFKINGKMAFDGQPVALEPGQRLPEPLRRVDPHPALQAPGVHRPPGLHRDPVPARRLPAEGLRRAAALEGRYARVGVTARTRQLER